MRNSGPRGSVAGKGANMWTTITHPPEREREGQMHQKLTASTLSTELRNISGKLRIKIHGLKLKKYVLF